MVQCGAETAAALVAKLSPQETAVRVHVEVLFELLRCNSMRVFLDNALSCLVLRMDAHNLCANIGWLCPSCGQKCYCIAHYK